MLRPLLSFAATALLLVALPHCSDGGTDTGGVCSSTFDSLVAYYDRCQSGTATALLGNQKGRYEQLCAKQLAAPGAGSDYSSKLQACGSSLATQNCDTEIECDDDYKGTLADGAECAEDFQCASGSCAKEGGASGSSEPVSCGKCAAKIPIGGACTGSSSECADKGTCVSEAGKPGRTCQAKRTAKAGEECISSAGAQTECEKGTSCYFPTGAVPTTARAACRAPAGAGGDCTTKSDCTSELGCVKNKCTQAPGLGQDCDSPLTGNCAKNLVCGNDKKCQNVTYVGTGQDCDSLSRRCSRGRCKGSSFEASGPNGITVKPGKCEDPLPDGAACSTARPTDGGDGPQQCDVFAKCINSVCTIFDPATCK